MRWIKGRINHGVVIMNILKRTTFVILLAVFFVVTCAKDDRITTMKDLKAGDWTDHGFSEAQKLELKSIMEDAVETGEIAGCSVLLIHRGEGLQPRCS
jgi:hypothetical protein